MKKCRGKWFWKQQIKILLFKVLDKKKGIEGEVPADNITTKIWKRDKEYKDAFDIAKPTAGDIEAMVLVLIAAILLE